MKILVADDSSMMRRILVASLRKWDYEVVEATNGAEAWEQLQRERFPLVLTDWMMPEVDGLELIQRIRGSESSWYTYIILLTSKSEKEDLVVAMEAGADDFLIKPCDPDELRVRLREGERIIRLEQTLAEQNRQLRETQAALVHSENLASLAQLAAGMAHEVNNPIAYVSNNLEVLRRDVSSLMRLLGKYREAREDLSAARPELAAEIDALEADADWEWVQESLPRLFESSCQGLGRVRDIVNNLRDFARLDEADFDALNINVAVKSTVDVLRHEFDAADVECELDLDPTLPTVLCRPAKIHQVLYNLLMNGIQASTRGSRIIVRTRADGDNHVMFEVQDSGCGIDPKNLQHIFEPFFTTKSVGRGSGLGLAIAYGIVQAHEGEITVDSTLEQGTTFRVRLPRHPDRQ